MASSPQEPSPLASMEWEELAAEEAQSGAVLTSRYVEPEAGDQEHGGEEVEPLMGVL